MTHYPFRKFFAVDRSLSGPRYANSNDSNTIKIILSYMLGVKYFLHKLCEDFPVRQNLKQNKTKKKTKLSHI